MELLVSEKINEYVFVNEHTVSRSRSFFFSNHKYTVINLLLKRTNNCNSGIQSVSHQKVKYQIQDYSGGLVLVGDQFKVEHTFCIHLHVCFSFKHSFNAYHTFLHATVK
jgi:hypothetical protein